MCPHTHWKDIPKVRKGRRPSSVLTCLLKRHHPGVIDYEGKEVLATTWEHYQAVKDNLLHSVANKVVDAFWLRYNYEDDYEHMANQHVGRCCKVLLSSIFYYARIQAIIDHFRSTENTNLNDKMAGKYYLKKDKYLAQRPTWCSKAAWATLSEEWSTPEWVDKSETARVNRTKSTFKTHKGGSNSMTTISQKLSEQKGEEVTQIEAWVYTHRGEDENNPNTLNTSASTACLPSSVVVQSKWQMSLEESVRSLQGQRLMPTVCCHGVGACMTIAVAFKSFLRLWLLSKVCPSTKFHFFHLRHLLFHHLCLVDL